MTLPAIALPYHRRTKYDLLATDPKDGPALLGRLHKMVVEAHVVRWPLLDPDEFDDLMTEFDNTKGGCGLVPFTPPDTGVPVDVFFEDGTLRQRKVSGVYTDVGPVVLLEDPHG